MNQQLDIDGPDLPDDEFEAWLDEIHTLAEQEAENRYWDGRVAKWEAEQGEREGLSGL